MEDDNKAPPPHPQMVAGEPRRPQPIDPRGMSINQINAHILDLEAELRRRDGTLAAKGSLSDVEAVGDPNAWLFHSPPQKQYIERGTPNYAEAEAAFTEYFVKNYPGPDTVIYNPNWHAPKIFAAAASAIRAALSAPGDD